MSKIHLLWEEASRRDLNDHLAKYRQEFVLPDDLIYLDGNSLGALPRNTKHLLDDLVSTQWAKGLIRSWNESWIGLPQRVAAKLAKLCGAFEDEIFIGESTSINLYKLAHSVLSLISGRKQVLTDALNFPSDFYVLQGLLHHQFKQHKLEILPSCGEVEPDLALLKQNICGQTALVCLSLVAFKSAYLYPMPLINQWAKEQGTVVIWDLSHAIGAVPFDLHEAGAHLAVGCTYKYLNGGPGASAFLYISREMQDRLQSPIWAWFGHASPFDFETQYVPKSDIWKFAAGTPPILSMAAIEPGIDLLLNAGIQHLREKSLSLSALFIEGFKNHLQHLGFAMASPLDPELRGSHISLRHAEGYRICQALIEPTDGNKPIIPDFRRPDNIRFGFAPLYNTHAEVVETVARLAQIAENKLYLNYGFKQQAVT